MDHVICPQGFTILSKDRINRLGGGVAVLCRNDWKIQEISNLCSEFECLWTKIETLNSQSFLATVYHPPNPEYNQHANNCWRCKSAEYQRNNKPALVCSTC
jgi:hypothetical protein